MIKSQARWLLPFLMLLTFACQKEVQSPSSRSLQTQSNVVICGSPVVKTLIDAGGVQQMGTVTISNNDDNIFIQIDAAAGRFLTRIGSATGSFDHVSDAISLPSIFYLACDGPGTPDDVQTFAPGATTSYTITLPASDFQDDGCIWFVVNVTTTDAGGGSQLCGGIEEFDEQIGSAGYQSATQYCKQTCPPDCGPGRTQTPGGWGAPPEGGNSATYLHANFESVFGDLTIGCAGANSLTLTTAQAITNLLPTGGQAAKLAQDYTNPASIQNVLVGHLVALTLSIGFDAADPNFSSSGEVLGNMIIGSGTFDGWTVSAFLAKANDVIGGCSSDYTIQQILTAASAINENFVNGTIDKGFLECPN